MDIRHIKALEKAHKERILKVNPKVPERCGIYFLLREEGDFKFAYIGKAKNLLQRLAEHLRGYQHIDLSIKKHGLYSSENPTGWNVHFLEYEEDQLNEQEQRYIKSYANAGYQLRNHESGGNKGKIALENRKSNKTYQQGLSQGYKNAQKDIKKLFDKHLVFSAKSNPPNKLQEKAIKKFLEFLSTED